MTDFNMWTFNSRVFPGIDPLVVRQGDRVRVRIGNLTMTNHPIHSTATTSRSPAPTAAGFPRARSGRRRRSTCRSARRAPSSSSPTIPGDWAFHCHKSHHTMNAMGHDVPNMIGVDRSGLRQGRSRKLAPGYMAMGIDGHGRDGRDGDAAAREHAADDDRHRPVRRHRDGRHVHRPEGAARTGGRRLRDPGWYQHPEGSVAYAWTGDPMPEPARAPDTPKGRKARQTDLRAVDPRTRRTASRAGRHEP